MNNLDQSILKITGLIAGAPFVDEHWALFGYKSRPRRGEFFRKFVDKSKLAKEDFLFKELLLLAIIDSIEAIREKDLTVIHQEIYIIGLLSNLFIPLEKSHIFKNESDFINFLKEGMDDYKVHTCLEENSEEKFPFLEILLQRIKKSLGEKDIKFMAGAFMFSMFDNKKGLILNRNTISGLISTDIEDNKFSFPLEKSKLAIFQKFAAEALIGTFDIEWDSLKKDN